MLASNGQVAYLGYDPKSDGTGEFLLALFSVLFLSRSPSPSLLLYGRSLFSFVLPTFSQARLLVSIPENRRRQCTESCRSLGPGLGPELELVAIAWY